MSNPQEWSVAPVEGQAAEAVENAAPIEDYEEWIYFYKPIRNPEDVWDSHVFSNWFPCRFVDPKRPGHTYEGAEQYMMAEKCSLFMDADPEANGAVLEEILRGKKEGESNHDYQARMKQLGRQVKGFNSTTWEQVAVETVAGGLKLKFSQNSDLKRLLLQTRGRGLAEAAPHDKIWGIGIGREEAIETNPRLDQFKGTNWLGQALMRVRDELLEAEARETDQAPVSSRGTPSNNLLPAVPGLSLGSPALSPPAAPAASAGIGSPTSNWHLAPYTGGDSWNASWPLPAVDQFFQSMPNLYSQYGLTNNNPKFYSASDYGANNYGASGFSKAAPSFAASRAGYRPAAASYLQSTPAFASGLSTAPYQPVAASDPTPSYSAAYAPPQSSFTLPQSQTPIVVQEAPVAPIFAQPVVQPVQQVVQPMVQVVQPVYQQPEVYVQQQTVQVPVSVPVPVPAQSNHGWSGVYKDGAPSGIGQLSNSSWAPSSYDNIFGGYTNSTDLSLSNPHNFTAGNDFSQMGNAANRGGFATSPLMHNSTSRMRKHVRGSNPVSYRPNRSSGIVPTSSGRQIWGGSY